MKKLKELLSQFLEKKEKISDGMISSLPMLTVLVIVLLFLKLFKIPLIQQVYNNSGSSVSITTGVDISSGVTNIVVEQISGATTSGSITTGEIISSGVIIPNDVRGYVDYILKKGIAGKDFFVINPVPQPVIHGKTPAENNKVLFEYAYKYRSKIQLPKDKGGYILITLNKPIANNRDIFLAINGNSKGSLSKKNSESVYDETEFLYDISYIPAGGYTISLYNYIDSNGYLDIGGFVSESGNGIKSITIVFK